MRKAGWSLVRGIVALKRSSAAGWASVSVRSPSQGMPAVLPAARRPAISQPAGAGDLAGAGVELVGISVDSFFAHKAFQEKIGIGTKLLSDFEPKGEVAKAYGSYFEPMGFANRTLVLVDEDGKVAWTYESPSPGEFPGPDVVREALTAS